VNAWKRNFIIGLVSVFLSLLLLEGGLRLLTRFRPIYDLEMTRYALELKILAPNPEIGFTHRPNAEGHFMGVQLKTNNRGWRERQNYAANIPTDKKRLIHLGDSVTLGWGVPEEKTYARLLEGPRLESLNFGHGNFNAVQIAAYYALQSETVAADAVIYHLSINDAEVTSPEVLQGPSIFDHSLLLVLVWSKLRILLPDTLGVEDDYQTYYRKLYSEGEGWQREQAAILRMKEIADKHGTAFGVALIPELHAPADYPFIQETKMITDFLTAHNIPYLDPRPRIAQVQNPYSLWVAADDAHPNAEAHRILAEGLGPFVLELLR